MLSESHKKSNAQAVMDIILKYFPQLSPHQQQQFASLPALYCQWNDKINVISRKDLDNLLERHVLHSLAVAHFFPFAEGAKVMDLGTGGGFPGIPLAIFFPNTEFLLVDSIGKKVKVVQEIAATLKLSNLRAQQARGEAITETFDFVVSRAVTNLKTLDYWTQKRLRKPETGVMKNGLLALKGGDLKEELAGFKKHIKIFDIQQVFEEPFFETKKLIFVPK